MSDVETITELNHRAARERELGERWDEIVRLRKRQKSLMKIAETACFSVACMLLGGTAVMLGFGLFRAAVTLGGAAACFFVGAGVDGGLIWSILVRAARRGAGRIACATDGGSGSATPARIRQKRRRSRRSRTAISCSGRCLQKRGGEHEADGENPAIYARLRKHYAAGSDSGHQLYASGSEDF